MNCIIRIGSPASTINVGISNLKGDHYLVKIDCSRILLVRILNRYLDKVIICAEHNSTAATAIRDTIGLAESPEILLQPRMVVRVLATALLRRAARNREERLDAAARGAF